METPPATKPYINDAVMINWEFHFDEASKRFFIYREDGKGGVCKAERLELCTTARSLDKRPGHFRTRSELIVNGMTSHSMVTVEVKEAYLRTLVVHDQKVNIGVIAAGSRIRQPIPH